MKIKLLPSGDRLTLTTLGLLLLVATTAEAKPRKPAVPVITAHTATADGATFKVKNPTGKRILFRLECRDVFMPAVRPYTQLENDWLKMPAHSTRKVVITAGIPIEKPCWVVWKAATK